MLTRLRVWFSAMSAWAAAIGALYLHPGLWALFAVLLALFLYVGLRDVFLSDKGSNSG